MPARHLIESAHPRTCCQRVRGGHGCTRAAVSLRNGQPYCAFHDPERDHLSVPAAKDKRRRVGWVAEGGENSELEGFADKLRGDVKRRMDQSPRSDYAKGDRLFTLGSTPVIFVSDTIPDRRGRAFVIVRSEDGNEKWSMRRDWVMPEMPPRDVALEFMAGRSQDYDHFKRVVQRKGFEAPEEELQRYWSSYGGKKLGT